MPGYKSYGTGGSLNKRTWRLIITKLTLLSGTANQPLALSVAKLLGQSLGNIIIDRFSDNEIRIEILEDICHKNVFIIQSTAPPVNDNTIELLLIIDAVKRASAASITAIIPYFGYARQNTCSQTATTPVSAKVIAKTLEATGVNKVLAIDLHTAKITGFFNIPCINLDSTSVFAADIKNQNFIAPTIVAPDLGGIYRAQHLAAILCINTLTIELALMHKHRISKNQITITKTTGKIKGHDCILIDDIVDTATTLCTAARTLKHLGARSITAYCTHPVLSGIAIENIDKSVLDEVVITDTILLSSTAKHCSKIRQLSIATVVADAIRIDISPLLH